MTSISVSDDVKEDFDSLKPEDMTHSEFVDELLTTYEAYESDDTVFLDVDAVVDAVTHQTAGQIELAAYRGVSEAINDG